VISDGNVGSDPDEREWNEVLLGCAVGKSLKVVKLGWLGDLGFAA
jgi:hypothetical protein